MARLPQIISFYEKYSQVFPNYVNLPENRYMFKNIERKQLHWDSKQHPFQHLEEKEERKKTALEQFEQSVDE